MLDKFLICGGFRELFIQIPSFVDFALLFIDRRRRECRLIHLRFLAGMDVNHFKIFGNRFFRIPLRLIACGNRQLRFRCFRLIRAIQRRAERFFRVLAALLPGVGFPDDKPSAFGLRAGGETLHQLLEQFCGFRHSVQRNQACSVIRHRLRHVAVSRKTLQERLIFNGSVRKILCAEIDGRNLVLCGRAVFAFRIPIHQPVKIFQRRRNIILLRRRLPHAIQRVIRIFAVGKALDNPLIGVDRVQIVFLLEILFANLKLRGDAKRAVRVFFDEFPRGGEILVVFAGHFIDQR